MTSMPIINDQMVVLFRRTGKRRGSYRSDAGVRLAGGGPRVVLQRSPGCRFHGQACTTQHGDRGECDENLFCVAVPFPGDNFRI
jgi:hypothetical protein